MIDNFITDEDNIGGNRDVVVETDYKNEMLRISEY